MSTLTQMYHTSVSAVSAVRDRKGQCTVDVFTIFVENSTGTRVEVLCHAGSTISDVKIALKNSGEASAGSLDDQHLICSGRLLKDRKTLAHYKVCANSVLHVLCHQQGGWMSTYFTNELDQKWDVDFTNISDTEKFERGGFVYKRPCGWYRYAIKVLGKYGDDAWLGSPGHRKNRDTNEWPVSYHGTHLSCAIQIVKGQYDVGKQKRSQYGPGIYSSPNIEVAATYAEPIAFSDGKTYKIVLQNRVDPAVLSVYGENKEIFVVPNGKHIRAYGILIRTCDKP